MNDQYLHDNLVLIFRALTFAAEKHRHQRRKDVAASPYINHPIALATVLSQEAGISDVPVICAALLHDTVEDTETSPEEIEALFGAEIRNVVMEVTDDQSLSKAERKRLQVENSVHATQAAKLVKLADKICNLRDMDANPPAGWTMEQRRAYFDWAKAVVDRIRGTHPKLETIFDTAYGRRPDN
ncbi:MAG: bifunctional (p)ppGpp synthetase/guanosine-3',5'-bis(diphosphate) 3'-pyrophosphohydrolase [Gammaproteobacteria bacterium]|nr:bifunctional (p)ppGpp synthetase/guanosine-3',5'-bis(diphosphate) 3'-pyrophosphohydrolase [Gammaproteobacteria bacterium]